MCAERFGLCTTWLKYALHICPAPKVSEKTCRDFLHHDLELCPPEMSLDPFFSKCKFLVFNFPGYKFRISYSLLAYGEVFHSPSRHDRYRECLATFSLFSCFFTLDFSFHPIINFKCSISTFQ